MNLLDTTPFRAARGRVLSLALVLGATMALQPGKAEASSSPLTKITRLMTQAAVPGNAYVRLAAAPGRSNCHSNLSYHYVFDTTTALGEKMFAQLMTAFVAGTNIKLIGDDTCGLHTGVETGVRIEMWE